MIVTPIKTRLLTRNANLVEVLTESLPQLDEESVVVIASKAFSFAENRLIPKKTGEKSEKHELVRQEAEYYLEPSHSKYNMMFTIKKNWTFVNAGIDESNSENCYTLWPKDPQSSVNALWSSLRAHYQLEKLGVIMTDSKTFPLSWGVVGHGIAHCGFAALKDYRGTLDLYGREMHMEQLNLLQSLAVSACMEMGEGSEQQPCAVITNIRQDVEWQNRAPSDQELSVLNIALEDDAYAPMIASVPWKKGGAYSPKK